MNGIILLTHGRQGEGLLESVTHMLGEEAAHLVVVSLLGTERRSDIEQQVRRTVAELQQATTGILFLTDLYGSTQATIAERVAASGEAMMCAHGVNLAMLLEAVVLRDLPLAELHEKALSAGKKSVVGAAPRRSR